MLRYYTNQMRYFTISKHIVTLLLSCFQMFRGVESCIFDTFSSLQYIEAHCFYLLRIIIHFVLTFIMFKHISYIVVLQQKFALHLSYI